MRIRTPIMAVAMTTALAGGVLGTSGPATADTSAPNGHHESNSIGPDDTGVCGSMVCISVTGDATGYTAVAKGSRFVGFMEMWGPGLPITIGPIGSNPAVSGSGLGKGSLCVQAWQMTSPDV